MNCLIINSGINKLKSEKSKNIKTDNMSFPHIFLINLKENVTISFVDTKGFMSLNVVILSLEVENVQ